MIIAKLQGGLGNQMFQYAFGRYLALKNHTCLKLDLDDLSDTWPNQEFIRRSYALNEFNLQAEITDRKEVYDSMSVKSLLNGALIKLKRITGYQKIVIEPDIRFHPGFLNLGNRSYLIGYWQNEKYFLPASSQIRREFTLKTNFINEIDGNKMLRTHKNLILNTTAVSLHFRRGDYVNDVSTNKDHGTCTEEYYYSALNHINTKVNKPHYFLFSDEPDWVERNIKIIHPFTIIYGNPGYVDLYLMSLCKHNIIANSSFSWWGAWLNSYPDKTVIAPQRWYSNENLNDQAIDIIPSQWIRM